MARLDAWLGGLLAAHLPAGEAQPCSQAPLRPCSQPIATALATALATATM